MACVRSVESESVPQERDASGGKPVGEMNRFAAHSGARFEETWGGVGGQDREENRGGGAC